MKFIKIFLISLLLSTSLFAKDYNYGVKIGGTYSNADVHNMSENYTYTMNYYRGVFLSFHYEKDIIDYYSMQLEVNFNQKGFNIVTKDKDRPMEWNRDVTIDTLELLFINKFKSKYINLNLGLFYNVIVYGKNTGVGDYDAVHNDFGYMIGLELNYKQYLLDFRFNHGFVKFFDFDNDGYPDEESRGYYDNSRQFVLSLGYKF